MTELKTDTEILSSKLDATREDIRRLFPLLAILEPVDRDQMAGFAERLLVFMHDIEKSYREQAREFEALRKELRAANEQTEAVLRKLDLLLQEE